MGSLRLPARVAIAVLLALVGLPLAAVGADAKGGLALTVHAGYQDVIKPGEWMPVTIDARNTGAGVDGTLEVQESLNAQPGVIGTTIYQEPISLAPGATKRVRIYVVLDTTGATIAARIVQNGRVAVTQDSASSGTTTALIGVLSDQASSLDEFAAIHPAGVAARVVHLRPDEIPDTAIPLRAFDLLAIDDFATDGLTAGQRAAVAAFVANGGDLLLGTGAAWHKTLAGLPAAILPRQVSGTALVNVPGFAGLAVELATGTVTSGHPWLGPDAQPLLLDRTVGAGTVTMATFDWNQDPVASWIGAKDLQRQIMARAIFGSGGAGQNFTYGFGGGGPGFGPYGGGTSASLASKSNALTSVLGNLPGLDLPSLQLTGALVLVYVLLVGPINYFVLGAMRRRALAWVTVPLIAVIAAAGAYGTGVLTKGRSVQANEVAILHLQPGSDQAYQETYLGIIPPGRGDYQATVGGERLLISPIATSNNGFGYNPGGIRVDVASNGVTLSGMTAFSLGGFATEGITSAPQLTGHLQLVNGNLTGTIENHSNLTFTDAVLIAGDSFQTIGALKPGASVSLSLVPKAAAPFGQPLFTRVYANGQYCGGGPCGPYGSSSADRDLMAKTQILSLLPTSSSFKGIAAPTSPLLVAWTHQSFESLTVSGSTPRTYAESAVALSLPVDQIGTGTLPAGVVNGRIVDVVGDSQGNGPPGMLLLQKGSVTYEFAPPLTDGAHLTGVSVNAQNPYGPKFGPPAATGQNGPAVQGQVWDWGRSTWTDISYQDNGATPLPDGAINPANGLVRLRLATTSGGLLAGALSISGTIQ
jgi:hypothetical protein